MANNNKVKYGLKNVHWAKLTVEEDGSYSFGIPQSWPGAVSMSLDAEGDTNSFYADDIVYYTSIANNGYSGDFESALIPDDFRREILCETLDGNGVQFEDSFAEPQAFALMFEFTGDVNAIRHVLYNCKMSRPSLESNTKEDSVEPQTETGTITASPLVDPKTGKAFVKAKTCESTSPETYNKWYTSVYTYVAEGLATLNVVSAEGTNTGATKITVTPTLGSGHAYKYQTGPSVSMPTYQQDLSSWTGWDGKSDITATTGNQIVIAEVDASKKAVGAGSATVTAKAGS